MWFGTTQRSGSTLICSYRSSRSVPELSDENHVIQFPKWFLTFVMAVTAGAGGWAYNTGCDVAVIRADLSQYLERSTEDRERLNDHEKRINKLEIETYIE